MAGATHDGGPLLDAHLGQWHFREVHHIHVTATPDVVLACVRDVTWGEAPVGRLLMLPTRNNVSPKRRVLADFDGHQLGETEDEIVFGVIGSGQGSPDLDGTFTDAFQDFQEPGYIKVGLNFRYVDDVLSTETRVWCTSESTRRQFRVYWSIIRHGSGLIRRSVLAAVRRRILAGIDG